MPSWNVGLGLVAIGVLGCATDPPPAQADGGSDSAATETGEPVPDTPPEPECPAALGELVECECGFVSECSIASADGTNCALNCPQEPTCEAVECEFDIAHGWPACVSVVNPEALDCVFAALLSGDPVHVELRLSNTYMFSGYTDYRQFTRVGPEQWFRTRDFNEGNDVGESWASWSAGIYAMTDAAIVECMSAGYPEAAFDCLFALGSETTSCTELPTCAP